MKKALIVKAWKDVRFRESLSDAEQALIPANPAGFMELTEVELEIVAGGLESATTGSSPSVCSCYVTSTGTGPGCSCTC